MNAPNYPPFQSSVRVRQIEEKYSPKRAEYILETLTEEELQVIDTTEGLSLNDYFNLAITKRILEKERVIEKFESYEIKDRHHYCSEQQRWISHEIEIVKNNKKCSNQGELAHEVAQDFAENHNGQRFRIFYCLKYPDKIKKK